MQLNDLDCPVAFALRRRARGSRQVTWQGCVKARWNESESESEIENEIERERERLYY